MNPPKNIQSDPSHISVWPALLIGQFQAWTWTTCWFSLSCCPSLSHHTTSETSWISCVLLHAVVFWCTCPRDICEQVHPLSCFHLNILKLSIHILQPFLFPFLFWHPINSRYLNDHSGNVTSLSGVKAPPQEFHSQGPPFFSSLLSCEFIFS